MSVAQDGPSTTRRPLRLWPGVVAAVLLGLVRFVLPVVIPESGGAAILGGLAGALAILVWWLFFSRATWSERLGTLVLMIASLFATARLVHASIANGMMGMMLPIQGLPVLCLALVVWATATRQLSGKWRPASWVGIILLICGGMALVRTGGLTGDAVSDLHWRWTKTPEERLVAHAVEVPTAPKLSAASSNRVATWPGFRGPNRDGIVRGARIETNWLGSPPVQLWRRPIGPGWSSFAVQGDLFYTQEQRGDDELVSCHYLGTGEPLWTHRDPTRFWESNAGAGPRGTPTLSHGRVFTLGATGLLNALDARDGSVVWSRNAASDTGRKVPDWGFASSPLVVGDTVIVAAAGVLAAYDLVTGHPRWFGPRGGWGYSSPHLLTNNGVAQILLLNGAGAIAVAPDDGMLLWNHPWKSDGIVQPAVLADGDILIGSGSGIGVKVGLRRLSIAHEPAGWTVGERWTSPGLKPYFDDFVVHKDHAYGFDGSLLACVNLSDGTRLWKGGRYGHGQLILLPDQDLLLVLSEEGELALVRAIPDSFAQMARFPAIQGKTWNHPALVGSVLLVRNGEEMAAFRLAPAGQ